MAAWTYGSTRGPKSIVRYVGTGNGRRLRGFRFREGRHYLGFLHRAGVAGKFEGESRALSDAITVCGQGAAHFLCGQGGAVEPEAVPVLLGGKPVGEDGGQIFRGDANAVVGDFDEHAVPAAGFD